MLSGRRFRASRSRLRISSSMYKRQGNQDIFKGMQSVHAYDGAREDERFVHTMSLKEPFN